MRPADGPEVTEAGGSDIRILELAGDDDSGSNDSGNRGGGRERGPRRERSESKPAPADDDGLGRLIPPEMLAKLQSARSGRAMHGERRTVTMLFASFSSVTNSAGGLFSAPSRFS